MSEFKEYTFYGHKYTDIVLRRNIPQYVMEKYPKFVDFLTICHQYLWHDGQPGHFISNLLMFANVDETTSEFLENFANQYLKGLKIKEEINKRTLIKYIKEHYQSAGTEKSFKFLFRIMFNEDISFYYPTSDILRVSDGKWQSDKVIRITNTLGTDDILGTEGTEVIGMLSGAKGLIDRVMLYDVTAESTSTNALGEVMTDALGEVMTDALGGIGSEPTNTNIAELYITPINEISPISSFIPGESVAITNLDGTMSFSERIFYIITDIEMSGQMPFYKVGDQTNITHPTGREAYAVVGQTSKGKVTGVQVINGGSGYTDGALVRFISGSGIEAQGKLVVVSGVIQSVIVINEGYGYKDLPEVLIIDSGLGAILYPETENVGYIQKIKILNVGMNYNSESNIEVDQTVYIYNLDGIGLLSSEQITASPSGAVGTVQRLNTTTGQCLLNPTNGISFEVGDVLTGLTSLSAGNTILFVWQDSGTGMSGSLGSYDGYYRNTDGHISSNKYIQDSYYYQDFSYVLTTLRDRTEWIDIVKNNVHPAGSIVFSFGEGNSITHDTSYGGWMSPILDDIELDKFNFQHQPSAGATPVAGNSTIAQYMDVVLLDAIYIVPGKYTPAELGFNNINIPDKSLICYGSEIEVI